jgi:hypothetical protein
MVNETIRRNTKLFATLSVLIIAVGMSIIVYKLYMNHLTRYDRNPLSDPVVGFQMLEPAKLPPGIKITDKRLNLRHSSPHKIKSTSAELNLRTEDWVYDIQESKAESSDETETVTDLRNFNPSSIQPTCTRGKSSKGQTYRLCHWTDYGRISVYEVKNIQKGVYIDTLFPASLQKPIALEDVDAYVDSFKPADPSGLPILADAI